MLRRPPRSTLFPYTRSSDLAKGARKEIAMIKAVVPSMLNGVVDRAMQVFGAMGLTPDTPLADLWISSRCLRIADGPDEVHLRSIARLEIAEGQERRGSGSDYLTPPEVLRAR